MAKKRSGFIYRDTKTGRFASKATWKRSKAKGGSRYVRKVNKKVIKRHRVRPTPRPEEPEEEFEEIELVGGFDSPGRKK